MWREARRKEGGGRSRRCGVNISYGVVMDIKARVKGVEGRRASARNEMRREGVAEETGRNGTSERHERTKEAMEKKKNDDIKEC